MPIYEYECSKCNQIFTMLSGLGQTGAKCPNCGGRAVKNNKVFAPAIRFEGSGFYVTDSKDEGDKPS